MTQSAKCAADYAIPLAMREAGFKRKPNLSAVERARRFAIEKTSQQRRYCDAFALWRRCWRKTCRRQRQCGGDARACLLQALGRVPHQVQWQARQDILEATPGHVGGPERKARQCMPHDFYE